MERARDEHPARPVVLLQELLYLGVHPFHWGAPLPRGYDSLPPIVGFSTLNNCCTDYSLPPFGPGLPYDPTEENLALWKTIYESLKPVEAEMNAYADGLYRSVGATRTPTGWFFDKLMEPGNVTVFPHSASLEYPRSDTGNRFRYIGGLPLKPIESEFTYPTWWPLVADNALLPPESPQRKKVVFVSQGTFTPNYSELLIPTIRALASRDDLIVIATLGVPGNALSDEELGMTTPPNTRVIDYFSYDVLLPFTDVFVSNAGHNGVMHGVMNGVPMLLAGTKEDKAEVANRAAYAGVAVNLRTSQPTEEQILEGLHTLLTDAKYKETALRLKKENEEMDYLGSLETIIDRLAEGADL